MLAFCPFYGWILDSVLNKIMLMLSNLDITIDELFAKVEGHIHSALYIIHL